MKPYMYLREGKQQKIFLCSIENYYQIKIKADFSGKKLLKKSAFLSVLNAAST